MVEHSQREIRPAYALSVTGGSLPPAAFVTLLNPNPSGRLEHGHYCRTRFHNSFKLEQVFPMLLRVTCSPDNFQIFNPVVVPDSVSVMNALVIPKPSSQVPLHHKPVFKDRLTRVSNNYVSVFVSVSAQLPAALAACLSFPFLHLAQRITYALAAIADKENPKPLANESLFNNRQLANPIPDFHLSCSASLRSRTTILSLLVDQPAANLVPVTSVLRCFLGRGHRGRRGGGRAAARAAVEPRAQ